MLQFYSMICKNLSFGWISVLHLILSNFIMFPKGVSFDFLPNHHKIQIIGRLILYLTNKINRKMKRKYTYFDQPISEKINIFKKIKEDSRKIKDIMSFVMEDREILELVINKIEDKIAPVLLEDYYYDSKDFTTYLKNSVVTKEFVKQYIDFKEFDHKRIPNELYLDKEILILLSDRGKLTFEQIDVKFHRDEPFMVSLLSKNRCLFKTLPHYYKYNLDFVEKTGTEIQVLLPVTKNSTFHLAVFYIYLKNLKIEKWNTMAFAICSIMLLTYADVRDSICKKINTFENSKFNDYIQSIAERFKCHYDAIVNLYMIETLYDMNINYL
jgi:hypothetical protein